MKGLLQNSPSLIAGILEPQKFEYSRLLRTPNFKINSKKSGIFTNLLLKKILKFGVFQNCDITNFLSIQIPAT